MKTVDLNQVVTQLSSILDISALKPDERKAEFDEKLVAAYKVPIIGPLSKLNDLLGKQKKDCITIGSDKQNICEKTLAMRDELKLLLLKPMLQEERDVIAKWIVEDWGGITPGKRLDDDAATISAKKNQSDASLFKCIALADEADANVENGGKAVFDFRNRIASWSKYLAFKKPDKYAIYDARVIYSLNWVLFKSDAKQYFPFLSGRNAVMGVLDYQVHLFLGNKGIHADSVMQALNEDKNDRRSNSVEQADSKKTNNSYFASRLISRRDLYVHNNEAFNAYCNLLDDLSKIIFLEDRNRLTKTEMLLFAIADAEIAESILRYISDLATCKPLKQ